ncbi:hypothetical protein [Rhodoferax sp.]|uniref:hypothetical protein n=1 Tax=Rhodoferax sp. TaxID=50421 RepID=UPI00276175D0|nr:hypothetical protein [Rhodoferax sp.]
MLQTASRLYRRDVTHIADCGPASTVSLLTRPPSRSARGAPDLALTLTQARLLVASLCGLHRVPMNAALVAERLPPPVRLGKVMAFLATLGIEARALQPRRLVDALRPGSLLQVGPQARIGFGATLADPDGASTPLLVSCETPGLGRGDGKSLTYAWVAIAGTSNGAPPTLHRDC